ncbi:MAG: hypothetical protein M0C28_45150 [Candidatus Moduliflexus flocculans]|nr:hypothetical protein [Candidatus Moduliflexus flocculans]
MVSCPPFDIRDLTLEELRAELAAMDERPFRAAQIFDWLYKKKAARFEDFTSLPKSLREKLAARFSLGALEPADRSASADGTVKYLFRLGDGQHVETVLIPAGPRLTICLSTQVGCKFACAFCASGRHGFKRASRPLRDHGPDPGRRARFRPRADELRLHGHGRAPRQLGERRKGHPDHERARRPRPRRPPHHRFDRGFRRRVQEARGARPPDQPVAFPARRHRQAARQPHAHQPALPARGGRRGGRALHPFRRPDDHPRIHPHPRRQRFPRRRRRPGRDRPPAQGQGQPDRLQPRRGRRVPDAE